MPAAAPDSARSRSSGYSTSAAGPAVQPLDRDVAARRRAGVASSRASVISASGTSPPHMPEWTAWVRVRTSTSSADQAAQAGGERRHADVPVAGVGDHDDVGLAAGPGASSSSVGQRLGADLLLALDEHRDADGQVVAEARAARRGGRRCRPCRRRRRGRRGGHRARWARTAGSPSRRGRSRAARRGGRRAARWARPPAPACARSPPAARRRRCTMSTRVEALRAEQARDGLGAALDLAVRARGRR